MEHPVGGTTLHERTNNEALDRNLQYLIVDTKGGFLGKETADLMEQMGYQNVQIVTIDVNGVESDEFQASIGKSDYIVCTDQETESRIKTLMPMDAVKPMLPLGLTQLDRHEVTPLKHGGSGQVDVSRFLNVLEEKLISVGFDYPDSAQ